MTAEARMVGPGAMNAMMNALLHEFSPSHAEGRLRLGVLAGMGLIGVGLSFVLSPEPTGRALPASHGGDRVDAGGHSGGDLAGPGGGDGGGSAPVAQSAASDRSAGPSASASRSASSSSGPASSASGSGSASASGSGSPGASSSGSASSSSSSSSSGTGSPTDGLLPEDVGGGDSVGGLVNTDQLQQDLETLVSQVGSTASEAVPGAAGGTSPAVDPPSVP